MPIYATKFDIYILTAIMTYVIMSENGVLQMT